MNASIVFYLCPNCFYASDVPDESHEHTLLRVDPGFPPWHAASEPAGLCSVCSGNRLAGLAMLKQAPAARVIRTHDERAIVSM